MTTVLVVLAVAALAALCLYLFFRQGSIADRARHDEHDPDGARLDDPPR